MEAYSLIVSKIKRSVWKGEYAAILRENGANDSELSESDSQCVGRTKPAQAKGR